MQTFEPLDRLSVTVLAEDSVMYESPCWGQHGISLFMTAVKGGVTRNILVDTAQDPRALLRNMDLLGIRPSAVDAIVITHCHVDHTGGLAEVLKAVGKKDLPVVAHPGLFRPNFVEEPFLEHVGISAGNSRAEIEAAGGLLLLTADPLKLMTGLSSTGYVTRRTDFEEVSLPLRTIDGEGRLIQDSMKDDISVIAVLPGGKLVILTGCSHAGIVNIARHSLELSGHKEIRAILGGLHLVDASEDRIRKTADALAGLPIESIFAGHCTGFSAQAELRKKIGDRFQPLQTGMRFEFP